MSVKCQVIMDAVERLAPRYLAESWDNVGLLLGSPAQKISKILVTLDVTQSVADQAIEDGIDLIITHHPVIFKAFKNIRTDLPQGQLLASLLKADIAVYATHTNLDSAIGGVNDILAERFQLQDAKPLAVSYTEKLYKLIVFIPKTHLEIVRKAMTEAGAGHLGNYSHCTFTTPGTGTFMPLEQAKPFIGQSSTLEFVEEVRLETIVTEKNSRRIIKEMLKAHPYEEVAYDLILLTNSGDTLGLGRIGKLATPMLLHQFVVCVKNSLGIEYASVAGSKEKMIKKVAVCGGSGASLIHKAAFAGADVLVTGDVKYHEAQDALAAGIAVIDAGHFATEQPVVSHVAEYLMACGKRDKWGVDIAVDSVNQDVLVVY
ncbi:Nif3-like dinuclear metal center hexameric protein [Pelosinus sp. sgz500959]|uniref:Nif3-like dinuclear metal center hexameric protein n=1 Tax=Pelosinus sp. sgz500959 TaxID=3242472 RepID=UPI00366FD197